MKLLTYKVLLLFLLAIVTACEKEIDNPIPPTGIDYTKGILCLNEGTFKFGNASISFINSADNTLYNDVSFQTTQAKLGDVLQSGYRRDGKIYLVVNNSQKIEVFEESSLKRIATWTGFTSPRFIAFGDDNKAYVSDLYASAIAVVDVTNGSIIKNIPIYTSASSAFAGWTEDMIIKDKKLYVVRPQENMITVINTGNDQIIDSAVCSVKPQRMVIANGKLWVLHNASLEGISSAVIVYNIDANGKLSQHKRLIWPNIQVNPIDIVDYPQKNSVAIINNGLYVIPYSQTNLNITPNIVQTLGNSFYGLEIDPVNGNVWVGDAKDYVMKGSVYAYNQNYLLLRSYNVGVNPSGFILAK
ncbi:MAG: hypothetical protein SGJ04_05500 [Bacteroidota bacterium]|nr:hypothetical protein [Bacteroidota bacterium]